MIPSSEIKVLDKNAEYFGVPSTFLMENAGKGVAEVITDAYESTVKSILILAGLGNNGGDGFVAARHLAKTFTVTLFLVGTKNKIRTKIARDNYAQLEQHNVTIHNINSLDQLDNLISQSDLIVDAMLGIGLSGSLREPYASVLKKLKTTSKPIIAVDIPTGIGTTDVLIPQQTITFHDAKEGMDASICGTIHIVDIGIPFEAQRYVGPGELSVYYPRSHLESHKGQNGSVLIIGGGPYTGAPALSGMAALRTGADLVFIATPQRSWQTVASFAPDLIVRDLHSDIITPGAMHIVRELLEKCNTVVIGPGLGTAKETEEAIVKIATLVTSEKKYLVLDADALKAISKHRSLIHNSPTIVTPHQAEFKQLTGSDLPTDLQERVAMVKLWADKMGITFLLKGPIDIISDGQNVKLNKVHNEAMTVGGTGDVLAGITGSLLAKNATPYNAARMSAFLSGAAGNCAFEKYSYGLLASDIINEIPSILKRYL